MRIEMGILEQMLAQARIELPNECCGLLSGRAGLIDGITRCQNQWKSPSAFSVSPRELFEFFRSLRLSGREFLGIYHSHPRGGGAPSPRDIDEFHYPGVTYWILSLHNRSAGVRCFEWDRGGFVEVSYEVLRNGMKIAPDFCSASSGMVSWE